MASEQQDGSTVDHGGRRDVLHRSAYTLAVKVLAAGVGFGFNVLLARLLGASGSGRYYVALNLAAVGSVFARVGMDQSLVRILGGATATGDAGVIRGTCRIAVALAAGISLVVAAALALAAGPLARSVFNDAALEPVIRAMAFAILPISLFTIQASALRGLHRPVASTAVLNLITPAVAAVVAWLLVPGLGIDGAVLAYGIGATVAFVAGLWSYHRATRHLPAGPPRADTATIRDSALPLLWIALVRQIDTVLPGLVLAAFAASREVGLYNAAARTAALTSFILVGVNAVVGARFAALFKQQDRAGIERLARYTTGLMTLAALPVLAVFLVFARAVMGIFGPEFVAAAPFLAILAVGQFLNVATGSVQILLIMSGNERIARFNSTLAMLVCIGSCALLIPRFGALGAAVAAALTVGVQNVSGAWWVNRKLGIRTNPFLGGRNER